MAKRTHPKTQAMDTFNREVAPMLAKQIGATEQLDRKGWSKRFALSRFSAAIANALQIPWRVQTVHDWFHGPETSHRAYTNLLVKAELPAR